MLVFAPLILTVASSGFASPFGGVDPWPPFAAELSWIANLERLQRDRYPSNRCQPRAYSELDQAKALTELVMQKINDQLGTHFRITYFHDQLPSARCIPKIGVLGPELCDDFFQMIVKEFKPGERESVIAFVLGHEIMHGFRSRYGNLTMSHFKRLTEDLKLKPRELSQVFNLLEHQNVDWAAIKIMRAIGYPSVEPATRYIQGLFTQLDAVDSPLGLARDVDRRVMTARISNMRDAFEEGFLGIDRYARIKPFCSNQVDRTNPGDAVQGIRYLRFSKFLGDHFNHLPPEMAQDCVDFSYDEAKSAMGDFLKKIKYPDPKN